MMRGKAVRRLAQSAATGLGANVAVPAIHVPSKMCGDVGGHRSYSAGGIGGYGTPAAVSAVRNAGYSYLWAALPLIM